MEKCTCRAEQPLSSLQCAPLRLGLAQLGSSPEERCRGPEPPCSACSTRSTMHLPVLQLAAWLLALLQPGQHVYMGWEYFLNAWRWATLYMVLQGKSGKALAVGAARGAGTRPPG